MIFWFQFKRALKLYLKKKKTFMRDYISWYGKNLRRRAVQNDQIEDAATEIAATCGSSGAPTGCHQNQRYPTYCVAAEAYTTRGCFPRAFSPPSLLQHIIQSSITDFPRQETRWMTMKHAFSSSLSRYREQCQYNALTWLPFW